MVACLETASTMNKTQSELKESRTKVETIRNAVSQVINPEATPDLPQRLIIPMVIPGHFFVACFDFCVLHPNFYLDISFYDSLIHGQERITENSTAGKTVKTVNSFFNKFILHEKKHLRVRQSNTDALRQVHYKAGPRQKNNYDCGIFAVASTLHLAERITLTSKSFSQSHVTKARSELAKTYATAGALMTSSLFRDCFPMLRGRSIVDAMGLEVINTHVDALTRPAAASFRRSTRSTNPTLFVGDGVSASTALTLKCWEEDIVSGNEKRMRKKDEKPLPVGNKKRNVQEISLTSETDEGEKKKGKKKKAEKKKGIEVVADTTTTTSTITSSTSMKDRDKDASDDSRNGDDGSEATNDTALYRIMHTAKVDCFNKLEDTRRIIEKYEATTGNRLRIQQSVVDRFRVYRCTSHEACPFLVRFSKRKRGGKFYLTKMNPKHGLVVRPNRAADGRQLKKRRQGKWMKSSRESWKRRTNLRCWRTSSRPHVPRNTTKIFLTWLHGVLSTTTSFVKKVQDS